MRVVLDPAVVVTGVLAPQAPEGRLLDLALAEAFALLHDDRILDAYRSALSRPSLGLPPSAVGQLVDFFAAAGLPVAPSGRRAAPGMPCLELALDGCADALVASQVRASPRQAAPGVRICTASELLTAFEAA